MKYPQLLIFVCLFVFFAKPNALATSDSLGIISQNGKQFILHKVDAGETLYGLSRRYQLSVSSIVQANSLQENTLKLGQEIKIPLEKVVEVESTVSADQSQDFHIVKAGETLFGISRLYDLSIQEIMALNDLSSNNLELGQRLRISNAALKEDVAPKPSNDTKAQGMHTVTSGQTLFSIARTYGMSLTEIKELNGLTENTLSVGQKLKVKVEAATLPVQPSTPEVVSEVVEDMPPTIVTTEIDESNVSTEQELEVTIDVAEKEKEVEIQPDVKVATEVKAKDADTSAANQLTTAPSVPGEGFDKVMEEGFAMKIDNSPGSQKFLALHRTLPIGKILQVKNQMNNQSIYDKIMG